MWLSLSCFSLPSQNKHQFILILSIYITNIYYGHHWARDCLWLRSAGVHYNLVPVLQGKLLLRHEKGCELKKCKTRKALTVMKKFHFCHIKTIRIWCLQEAPEAEIEFLPEGKVFPTFVLDINRWYYIKKKLFFSCLRNFFPARWVKSFTGEKWMQKNKRKKKKKTVKNISGGNSWDRAVSEVLLESITFI